MALELYVKQAGEGRPVLLLHGLFGAGGNLGALSRSLQDAYTVYSIDLPNTGVPHGWQRLTCPPWRLACNIGCANRGFPMRT